MFSFKRRLENVILLCHMSDLKEMSGTIKVQTYLAKPLDCVKDSGNFCLYRYIVMGGRQRKNKMRSLAWSLHIGMSPSVPRIKINRLIMFNCLGDVIFIFSLCLIVFLLFKPRIPQTTTELLRQNKEQKNCNLSHPKYYTLMQIKMFLLAFK